MKVVFCNYRNRLFSGNSLTCLAWAANKAKEKNQLILVYTTRPGTTTAELFAEVDSLGIRLIPRGTYAKIRKGAIWESL